VKILSRTRGTKRQMANPKETATVKEARSSRLFNIQALSSSPTPFLYYGAVLVPG
jgi:hypothetical protein